MPLERLCCHAANAAIIHEGCASEKITTLIPSEMDGMGFAMPEPRFSTLSRYSPYVTHSSSPSEYFSNPSATVVVRIGLWPDASLEALASAVLARASVAVAQLARSWE